MWLAAKDSTDGALKYIAQSSVNAVGDLSMQGVISAGGKIVVKADDSAGGDLSGTYPSTLTVAKLQGRTVASTAPTNGFALVWNNGLSQWEPQAQSGSGGIANPGTKAANDILQYTGAVWDAVGAAVGDPVAGPLYTGALTLVGAVNQLWNTDGGGNIGAAGATRPDKVYAKTSLWQGANQVLDTSMTLAGDVSGGYGANTVDKIKNVTVLAGVPSDRQMFTYDSGGTRWEAQWPGMTNFSENRTFTILPAGSTVATINTALTDYDVVYLEAGTYTMGGTPIAIPTSKALIGLGDSTWGNTNGVYIDGSAGATGANFITMNNGYLSNVTCRVAAAQANDIILGSYTNLANYVDRVVVYAVAACGACAFVGGFVRVDRFRVDNINAVWVGATTYSLYGPSVYSNFIINSAPTYGFTLVESGIRIDSGYVYGNSQTTNYGIYYTNSGGFANHYISNVRFYQCGYGIYYNYATNRPWRIFISNCDADSCNYGFFFTGPAQLSMHGCQAIGCSNSGFYFTDIYYSSIAGCAATACERGFYANGCYRVSFGTLSAAACNITAGLTYGNFILTASNSCSFTGLSSFQANNTSNAGFYITTCGSCMFSGLADYESTYGVYVAGTFNDTTIANVETYNTGSYGFYTDANQKYRMTFSNISSYSSGAGGVYIQLCDYSLFSGLRSDAAATQGIYIVSCDNSGGANWISTTAASTGIYVGASTYCTFSSLVSYYAGAVGIYLDTDTVVNINGGTVYSANTHGFYEISCNYCKVTGVTSSSNRTNGSHGFFLDTGNTGNSLVSCLSYFNKRHGFYSALNVNTRSHIVSCQSIANSQESAGTYSNYYLQACSSGSSFFSACHSVRTASAAGWNVHGDWNSFGCNET